MSRTHRRPSPLPQPPRASSRAAYDEHPANNDPQRYRRRTAYRRDIGACQRCGNEQADQLTTHHIEPLGAGGVDAPCNWCVLCRACHDAWHDYESECRRVIARQRFSPWLAKGKERRRDPDAMPRL